MSLLTDEVLSPFTEDGDEMVDFILEEEQPENMVVGTLPVAENSILSIQNIKMIPEISHMANRFFGKAGICYPVLDKKASGTHKVGQVAPFHKYQTHGGPRRCVPNATSWATTRSATAPPT